MKCPKCNVEMKVGFAIKPMFNEKCRTILPLKHELTYEEMKIIEVLKCISCGYSDDGQ